MIVSRAEDERDVLGKEMRHASLYELPVFEEQRRFSFAVPSWRLPCLKHGFVIGLAVERDRLSSGRLMVTYVTGRHGFTPRRVPYENRAKFQPNYRLLCAIFTSKTF
jgi:hypothetical protein